MGTESTARLVLSVEETRQQLGLSRGLMYEAIRRGQIPSIRIGRRILIPRVALEKLLDEVVVHKENRESNVKRPHQRGNKNDPNKS